MSKKRPRMEHPPAPVDSPGPPKQDPRYWLGRLFKPAYSYKGERRRVRNWSVKIQYAGRRKTFSLRSSRRSAAAVEASSLYRTLCGLGWDALGSQKGASAERGLQTAATLLEGSEKFSAGYWAQRLVHRQYAMRTGQQREFSVRVDYGGVGHYFPLGTDIPSDAASKALRVYLDIVRHGWDWVKTRYPRELTVAFRWLDVPLAWTYTTIHTESARQQTVERETAPSPGGTILVSITDSDAGIRRALKWCVNNMSGFRCVGDYGSGAEVLREVLRQPFHLALINHALVDKPGAACLEEMKRLVPDRPALLYSAYEDSEELFRATPGGAGTYLLKRTAPTKFLEPIAGRMAASRLLREEVVPVAWQYFKASIASMTIEGPGGAPTNLTQREQEVLVLIGKGHPDKDIAYQLGISIYTVHEHVRNIFEKLGAHNRTEAAVRLLQK